MCHTYNIFHSTGILGWWALDRILLINKPFKARFSHIKQYLEPDYSIYVTVLFIFAVYIILNMIKTMACSALYRLLWDNVHDRKFSLGSGQLVRGGQHFMKFVPKLTTTATTETRTEFSESLRPSTSTSEKFVAITLTGIRKRYSGFRRLKIDDMTVLYGKITMFYSFGDAECGSTICRLVSGFSASDRGKVTVFPMRDQSSARMAFVVTVFHCSRSTGIILI